MAAQSNTRVYKLELTDAERDKLIALGYTVERAYEYDADAAKRAREREKAKKVARTEYIAALEKWMGTPETQRGAPPVKPAILND